MIGEHLAAFEYDWRSRFHLALSVVGGSMSWGEALRLTRVLAADPSSHVAAAVAGWRHPWSREAVVAADLFDLTHQVAAGKRKPKPYTRPWDPQPRRLGGGARMSKAGLRAALDTHRAATAASDEVSELV